MSTQPNKRGRLFGVGLGPGDPELLTIKARNTIEAADVIAYPGTEHGPSVARRIAAPYIRKTQIEVALNYPVTTGRTDHPGGYEAAMSDFYDECASQLTDHLDLGLDVAVLCGGDPFMYGSYMYIHDRLAPHYETHVIPGVTSFSAAAASAGAPLVRRDDVLTILPGTLPQDVLSERLRNTEAAVILKLGRTFEKVREAARDAGAAERGLYVERASSAQERTAPLEEVDGKVPYMSLVLIPSATMPGPGYGASSTKASDKPATTSPSRGHVAVVGLGPGGPEWLTPEASGELAAAEHIVGYDTYIARVPVRAGQQRHASDNRVEIDRARHALKLAAEGAKVAVVSSGDPGIFAMAAAVLEAAEEPDAPQDVEIRIIPGLSAMQAAASRVGAPLGHDFCVVSLSDQLKPWEIIERRLEAAGAGDLVLALYNPASRTRREQLDRAVAVMARHREPQTPVIVARAVGDPEEALTITTLGELDTGIVDMRTLLIIGSSTTRTVSGSGDTRRVYTPRSYPA